MEFQVVESLEKKEIRSKEFNCVFNKETKTLAIWGRTPEETPLWCPFGPLIAYIELSETTSNMFKLLIIAYNNSLFFSIQAWQRLRNI